MPVIPRTPALLAALGTTGAALWLAASAQAARPTCHGLPVTTTKSSGLVIGTPRRDVIRLTGPGHVRSGAGNDVVCGSPYMDVIETGAGNDVVVAGRGHDRIRGGAGNDNLFGEGGNDHVDGGAGRDVMAGGAGRNRYAPVRKAAKSEDGLAVPGDTIVRAVRTVSIIAGTADVASLASSGGGFGFAWLPPSIPQATSATPVWAVMRPAAMNWLVIPELVGVYWGQAPMAAGAVLRPAQSSYARFGQTWDLNAGFSGQPDLAPQLVAPSRTAPQAITVRASNITPAPYLAGLAMAPSGSGGVAGPLAPAQAVGINAFQELVLPQPQILRIWAGPPVQQRGEMIDPGMIAGQGTAVQFTTANPTVALSYSAARGFTQ